MIDQRSDSALRRAGRSVSRSEELKNSKIEQEARPVRQSARFGIFPATASQPPI
jgi:hypothetical protein